MRILIWLLISTFSLAANAHNMSDTIKKAKIKRALAGVTQVNSKVKIDFEFSEYTLSLSALDVFANSGDQDIEEFRAKFSKGGEDHELNCDMVSGEYLVRQRSIAQYYIVYKNCTLTNLETYKRKDVSLSKQIWEDWKY